MLGRSKRPTIKQVAAAAGVSTQTVSRVINNRLDVSPETKNKVQKIVDELGYRPSALARSLIRRRSYTLGVVTAGLQYIGPSRTLSGITNAASESGFSLLLKEQLSFEAEEVIPILEEFTSRHVDGIIWAVPEVGANRDWLVDPPLDLRTPIVFLTMSPRKDIPVVSVDNYLGGRMAMAHLLEQGYRYIGHISGPLDWWEARQRKAAWQDALGEAGIKKSEAFWVEGNWFSESGAQAFEKLFQQFPHMDAIFAANDQMALGVIRAALQKNLSVPQDLGLVGFDNIPESPFFYPALTTMQSEQYNVGKTAVEEVVKLIELGWQDHEVSVHPSIMLKPTLVVRESSLKNL